MHTRWATHEADDLPGGGCQQGAGSVSKIVNNGNKVVFDADGSYIENKWSKDRLCLREDNGVYVLDMLVASSNANNIEQGFGRPGAH